jgi:hypothetical protein
MTLSEKQISTLLMALDVAFSGLDEVRDRVGRDFDPNFDALCADVRSLRAEWESRQHQRNGNGAFRPEKAHFGVVADDGIALGVDFEDEYSF